jgi:glycosyltransferase involved in cell wall biosynthesis
MSDPLVSVVLPVFNGGVDLQKCLQSIADSTWRNIECVVVDDASDDGMTAPAADSIGARVIRLDQQKGPAAARNRGVEQVTGDIIFFVDADVLVHEDTIERGVQVLQAHPEITAVIGSYDASPGDRSFISQYRNLYHHWIHQTAHTAASTFWTGCGLIRRKAFVETGGFNEDFDRPSIEDIEYGNRLIATGHVIRLEKEMQCQHLKQWTLWNVVKTDVFQRGIPWMKLLLANRDIPNDLNLSYKSRVATVMAGLLVLAFILIPLAGHATALLATGVLLATSAVCSIIAGTSRKGSLVPLLLVGLPVTSALVYDPQWLSLLPLATILTIVWTQRGFYQLVARRRNLAFAFAVIPMQVIFFIGCATSAALGIISHFFDRVRGPDAR